MTIWTGSSYVYFGVEGPLVEVLSGYRYDFDDNFHMTTHFLGKAPLEVEIAERALGLVRCYATELTLTTLELEEFATFGPPQAQARVAKFHAPVELFNWRDQLAGELDAVGATVSKDWPWSPHMTYSYGYELDRLKLAEDRLLAEHAALTLTSLCMYDGRARLVVPL